MANPSVEKLKDLGLRHGEKVVVGLSAAVFLFCVSRALSTPSIDLTPDQVKNDAQAAQRNISKTQAREEVAKTLEADFLKIPDLPSKVAEVTNRRPPSVAAIKMFGSDVVKGGVKRRMPEVLAPSSLVATVGRGGLLVYKLDKNGEPVLEGDDATITGKAAKKPAGGRRRGARGPAVALGPSGAGMTGTAPSRKGTTKGDADGKGSRRDRKKADEGIVGSDEEAPEEAPEEEPEDERKPVEVIEGKRWVAVLGLFDNRAQRKEFADKLQLDSSTAYPEYLRLEIERQQLLPDGSWTAWKRVDRHANRTNELTLKYVPALDTEKTVDEARLEPLVDELPFLKVGLWHGVHHRLLLSAAAKERKTKPAGEGSAPAMGMGMGGRGAGRGTADPSAGYKMDLPRATRGDDGDSARTGSGMGPRMGMMPGSTGARSGEARADYPRSELDKIMVRSIDFTVAPEATYHYRSRIVVKNPNLDREEDVDLGIDTKAKELLGPWSEETSPVTVPADVATFAMAKAVTSTLGRGDEMDFQVARWNPEDGQTILEKFTASPGEVVGAPKPVRVPNPEGTGVAKKSIDFTSRQVVLDTEGGTRPVEPLKLEGVDFTIPALAVVLRPDGSVAIRNEVRDRRDSERLDMEENYQTALEEAAENKPRTPKASSMSPAGMMPSMGPTPPGGAAPRSGGRAR